MFGYLHVHDMTHVIINYFSMHNVPLSSNYAGEYYRIYKCFRIQHFESIQNAVSFQKYIPNNFCWRSKMRILLIIMFF